MEQYTLCVYTSCICCTHSVPLLVAKKLVQCLKHLEMAWQVANLHWGFSISILVSCDCNLFTFWHSFLKYLIVDHIATVDSEFSQLWSMNSCLFDVVFELWYGVSEALLYLFLCNGYLIESRRPLWSWLIALYTEHSVPLTVRRSHEAPR